jgi:hypothetical protein
MTTKLDLYQEAIRLFGDARLDSITDDTESRYALDDAWDGAVTFCLRAAPWRFAMKTKTLDFDELPPINGGSGDADKVEIDAGGTTFTPKLPSD